MMLTRPMLCIPLFVTIAQADAAVMGITGRDENTSLQVNASPHGSDVVLLSGVLPIAYSIDLDGGPPDVGNSAFVHAAWQEEFTDRSLTFDSTYHFENRDDNPVGFQAAAYAAISDGLIVAVDSASSFRLEVAGSAQGEDTSSLSWSLENQSGGDVLVLSNDVPVDYPFLHGFTVRHLEVAQGVVLGRLDPGVYDIHYNHVLQMHGQPRTADSTLHVRLVLACGPADLDSTGTLNLDDVNLFANAFVTGDLAADMDANGTLNLDDINLFANAFLAGCP